jgi:hypothetical protein
LVLLVKNVGVKGVRCFSRGNVVGVTGVLKNGVKCLPGFMVPN